MRCAVCLVVLVALLAAVVTVAAVDCTPGNGQGCAVCTAIAGCGYCYSSEKCLEVNGTQPVGGVCLIGWSATAAECPKCGDRGNCMDCRLRPECTWCSDQSVCKEKDNAAGCQQAHSCACKDYMHCSHCKDLGGSGCEWCADYNSCEQKDHTSCKRWAVTCPACDTLSLCSDCLGQDGCTWCSTTDTCTATTMCPDNSQVTQCTETCTGFSDCNACAAQKGCGWCEHEGKCYGGDTKPAGCLMTHVCSKTERKGFDGGSFVGGMFLVIGLIVLGVGGFFGWKYYQRRQGYVEA